MNSETYSVWHRNGTDSVYSQWYQDAHGLDERSAENMAESIRLSCYRGWNAQAQALPDGINPNE